MDDLDYKQENYCITADIAVHPIFDANICV